MTLTVLITGASAGIGAATAKQQLAKGYRVFAGARRVERMRELAEAGAILLSLDVTDDASIVAAFEAIKANGGRLDVLINNAGTSVFGALEDVALDEGRHQFEVNLFGIARMIQLAAPIMRNQGGGKIINVSSAGGKIYAPLASWYHASKFALEGMSDCLRMELAPFGIDVIVIQPGTTRTEMMGQAANGILSHSGESDYAFAAMPYAKALNQNERSSICAAPETVARVINKAITASRPRTRYTAGGGSSLLLGLRRLLSDRKFDAFMRKAIGMPMSAKAANGGLPMPRIS